MRGSALGEWPQCGHSQRSSVLGDQVVCPILYVLLPLSLENSSNEDQSGKEEWETKSSQYIQLHPHLECGSFQKEGRVALKAVFPLTDYNSRGMHTCLCGCERECVCVL